MKICLILILLFTVLDVNDVFADEKNTLAKQVTQKTKGEYVRKRFLKLMKQPFVANENPQQKKILIIGDSHAQDFLNAIFENNYLSNHQIKTRYIPTRCQIALGEQIQSLWLDEDKELCNKSDNLALARPQINQADVIILAAFWRKWAAVMLPETIKNLQLNSNQQIYVIGRRSFRTVNPSDTFNLTNTQLKQLRNPVDENQIEINNIMQSTLDKNIFINVHKLLCGKVNTCPAFTDDLTLISFDGGHLSQDGARFFGRILFEQTQLRSLIKYR